MSSRIEQLIDEIEEYIEGCKPKFMSSTEIIVNKDEIDELLRELRMKTPDEIKRYQKIISNQDAILQEARSQADAMVAEATAQTNELVNEHEIMQRAYAEANSIIEQANAQAQSQYQQPVHPQQPQYQNPVQQQYTQPQNPQTQQSPYAVNNTAPIGENAFVKALKNIPVVFTSFFKDSKTVIKTAKAEKDIILGALFSAIFFIALILGNMFLMLSMSALDFPKTLLVSLVTAVLIGGFYSVILFAYVKKYKTEENTAKAFIDSFITFSIESIPASIGWILAGLCALISVYMFLFFFIIVMLYLVISLVNQVKANVPEAKNSALFTLILTLIVAVAFMIVFFIGAKLTMWSFNTSTFATSVLTSLIGGGSYSSLY